MGPDGLRTPDERRESPRKRILRRPPIGFPLTWWSPGPIEGRQTNRGCFRLEGRVQAAWRQPPSEPLLSRAAFFSLRKTSTAAKLRTDSRREAMTTRPDVRRPTLQLP